MVTIIALAVLLICVLFVKSTVIITYPRGGQHVKMTEINVLLVLVGIILAFLPITKWCVLIGAPIITTFWFGTDGFDDNNCRTIEVGEDTPIGKILLFKI